MATLTSATRLSFVCVSLEGERVSVRLEATQALGSPPVPSCGHGQWEGALQLLVPTLLEPTNFSSR